MWRRERASSSALDPKIQRFLGSPSTELLPALGELLCYVDAEAARRLHLFESVVGLNRHHFRVRVDLADDREGSPADFVVYPSEILAKNTHTKKQHTPYQEHC